MTEAVKEQISAEIVKIANDAGISVSLKSNIFQSVVTLDFEQETYIDKIKEDDKLHVVSKNGNENYDILISTYNRLNIVAEITKDYGTDGPDHMILLCRKKKNFLRDFTVTRIQDGNS